MSTSPKLVVHNAAQVVTPAPSSGKARRGGDMGRLLVLANVTVAIRDGIIDWLGPASEWPGDPEAEIIDAAAKTVLPGFIDSHTHLVFSGSREDEFEQRIAGRTYAEIAAAGGGINA